MPRAEVAERSAAAVRLLAEGQATTQAAAAAMAGVGAMNVSHLKLKEAPPFSTIRRPESRFELVEVAPGVSYEKEFRVADGLEAPRVANCRAQRNYRCKKAALQEAACRARCRDSGLLSAVQTAATQPPASSLRKRKIKSEEQPPDMPAGARVKVEEQPPDMPAGARVKVEELPPMPPDARIKLEH